MEVVLAKFKIITPMFIGNANQNVSDGVRPPSVKGVLRFWWRALNWDKFIIDTQNNEQLALQNLHQEEARLFGSSVKNGVGGQGCFLLSIEQFSNKTISEWGGIGTKYLGYGLFAQKNTNQRESLKEEQEFLIKIVFKNSSTALKDIESIKETLNAWSFFGGLGGRSRNSMGSVSLIELNERPITKNKDNLNIDITNLLHKFSSTQLAPYTAFSKDSKFGLINTKAIDAQGKLEELGNIYKNYCDYNVRDFEDRIALGTPRRKNNQRNITERRASPLFFHLHSLENEIAVSYLFLPSRIFHPSNKLSNVKFSSINPLMEALNV